MNAMSDLLEKLFAARDAAHMWHWKVKSLSLHLALGDLYEGLVDMADELAELFMGQFGQDSFHVRMGTSQGFSETDPLEFIKQLVVMLEDLHSQIPQDGHIVSKFEELQNMVIKTKYKMENLA